MNTQDRALQLLLSHKLKKTSGRLEILKYFLDQQFALSHSDIENELGASLDRVTIYRTLNTFEESGITHKVLDEGGVAKYALCSGCSHDHHHDEHIHFHCNECQNIFCLDDTLIPTLDIPSGYLMEDFNIIVKGICKHCNQ